MTFFNSLLEDAVRSVELTLKRTYEKGVHRNTKRLETIVWAVSSDKFLDVNVQGIWNQYLRICSMLNMRPEEREKIPQRLALLCKPEYGPILVRTRHANYTFSEKMMRAYARLRAEYAGCQLGEENPDYSNGAARTPERRPLLSYHDPQ